MKTALNFNKPFLGIILLIILFMTACKKEGTGGKSSISGYVKHHASLIPNAVVYIKYGATEFPGNNTANYDASVTTGTDAHYEFKDLRKGDYFLYGVGFDTNGQYPVVGGVAVTLKYNKTFTINVPVTE